VSDRSCWGAGRKVWDLPEGGGVLGRGPGKLLTDVVTPHSQGRIALQRKINTAFLVSQMRYRRRPGSWFCGSVGSAVPWRCCLWVFGQDLSGGITACVWQLDPETLTGLAS